jgi:hypothetical protein
MLVIKKRDGGREIESQESEFGVRDWKENFVS